jgi:hypothetical protein
LERAAQLEHHDARFELFSGDFQRKPPSKNYLAARLASSARSHLRRVSLLLIAGELTNCPRAVRERVQQGIAPTRRKKGREFLVHRLVGLRKKANVLSRGRGGEFANGDDELGFAIAVALLERKHVELSKLLSGILLGKSPIAHNPSVA